MGDPALSAGDFVKTEDENFDLHDICEHFTKYNTESNSRVFYPNYFGGLLNERYLVRHKLGFGGGFTVGMAHDRHDNVP
ncbi:hypothetical protein N7520_003465 [Penicillium odoratum]|uniref:uncharacterized protein n=1 Tax=Penicillium odoratum TaxID=1167516 RepID=UPI0025488F6E|nr:uncharacterized protein N7520_003465 [Penicillium odoratum]KAJ5768906.1 hypothetical protein N7520_003465 [Penicillium odoratum]